FLIGHYLQNMRMPTNKQLRRIFVDFLSDAVIILSRISSDMRNPHIDAFTNEPVVKRKLQSRFGVIDISPHGTERLEFLELVRHAKITDVACMPYLIGHRSVFKDYIVKMSVSVGKQQDLHKRNFAQSSDIRR